MAGKDDVPTLVGELVRLNRYVAALAKSAEEIHAYLTGALLRSPETYEFDAWTKRVHKALAPGTATTIADLRAAMREMSKRVATAELDIQAIRTQLSHGASPWEIRLENQVASADRKNREKF